MDVFAKLFLSFPSNLVFLPLVALLGLCLIPKEKTGILKVYMLVVTILEALLVLHVAWYFQNTGVTDQFVVDMPWISSWNVRYLLGLDGVSVLMLALTVFLLFVTLIGTWNSITKNLKFYFACLLVLLSATVGVFCALDLFLFFVFWELLLIPMYFLIGIWGGENRGYAAIKFVLYTMAGSVLMLVAIVYLYFKGGQTFNLLELMSKKDVFLRFPEQLWLFLAMAIAFAIKVPLFPTHTWLPDAHVQAPTMGSVLLAGVLLKMGVYGFFRIAMPLFPQAVYYLQPYLMALAAFGVLYGALAALAQKDIKKLIAYSSVSHMGVVMLGIFSLNQNAMTGGLYQMINHGVSTGALFLLIGMLYDRTHTRKMADYSGLAKRMPVYTIFFFVATLSSIAVPLTNGFVGEFLTLLGAFSVNRSLTILAATGVIFGAVYMLTLFQKVFLGPSKPTPGTETDLKVREVLVMIPFVLLIFGMGIFPQIFLQKLELPAETVLLKINEAREAGLNQPQAPLAVRK